MINTNNNFNNQPVFQANLHIDGLKLGGSKKIKEVKRLFAEKTQHYADDVFSVRHFRHQNSEGKFFHTAEFFLNGENIGSNIVGNLKKFFENNSTNQIAKGLVRILKLQKAESHFGQRVSVLNNNLRKTLVSELKNSSIADLAEQKGDKLLETRHRLLAENNSKRIDALRTQRAELSKKQAAVLDKITDNHIFYEFCK